MEPIAITGMGCRLPGDSDGVDALWQNLIGGRDLIRETPPDRWNIAAFYASDPAAAGRTNTRWGGFVSRPDEFDAAFFGIAPREAMRMDPQQRWLLETTWEALEDAGYPPGQLAGTDVAVYVGVSGSDYGDVQRRSRYGVDAYTNSGSALSIAANRISYAFDFRGPSVAVDTACSSSLVALDLACRALWSGDAPVAIVGACNSLFAPDLTIGFSKASMLSSDGRCKAFDASADGYVRSEGAACVVLRRLSQAIANGDRVYAAIRSTYVNQDGRTEGMTVPSIEQQQRLLDRAYRLARIRRAQVSYVEAHGTGTSVGDPIEAIALGNVLGRARPRGERLLIGSVKSNLGHLEPASGMAGLVKLALALHHRTIPPSLHFREPNPRISFDELRLAVPTGPIAWRPRDGELLCAGINSFGFGGTNAHAVLTSVPPRVRPAAIVARAPFVWTVSARSPGALREAARRDASFLLASDAPIGESSAVVQRRRSHHSHRLAIVAGDAGEIARRLADWAQGGGGEALVDRARDDDAGPVFVFSGQGSQWPRMGRDLVEENDVVRATIERLDALMRPAWGHSVAEVLARDDDAIFDCGIGQPAFFALQVAIARLLDHWGVRPRRVLGHSLGEVAAAHVAGALSDADAAHLVVERSRAQQRTRGAWRMAAAGVSESEASALLAPFDGRIHVAAINSPTHATLAGDADAVQALAASLAARGRFVRLLPLQYAFHTPAMDAIRDAFVASIANVRPAPGSAGYLSAVAGADVPGEALDAGYWWRNLREPVRFAAAVREAIALGHRTFVEIGPHPSLVRYIGEALDAQRVHGHVVGTLERNEPASRCLARTLASLHVRGIGVDWARFNRSDGSHRSFPAYPWQRERFWAESPDARASRIDGPAHPLLGVAQRGATASWRADIDAHTHPFLGDHRLEGKALFPAAGYLEMMLAAARCDGSDGPIELRDVHFERTLWLDTTQLVETAVDAQRRSVSVAARPASGDGQWQRHARARAHVADGSVVAATAIPSDARDLDLAALYARFERAGHGYGPLMRTLRRAAVWRDEFWGRLGLAGSTDAERFLIHPALLDGALQLTLASMPFDDERDAIYVPVCIERVQWWRAARDEALCRVRRIRHGGVRSYADIELFTPQGEPIAVLHGCCCVKRGERYRLAANAGSLYRETWVEAPSAHVESTTSAPWVVVGARDDNPLADAMRAAGIPIIRGDCDDVPAGERRIVFWAIPPAAREPSSAAVLDATWPLVRLAQRLGDEAHPIRLVVVTAGATWGHPVDAGAVDAAQAAVAAVARTIATELPHVDCRSIDLEASDPRTQIAHVLQELAVDDGNDEIAYRAGRRFAQRVAVQRVDALALRTVGARQRARCQYRLHAAAPGSIDQLRWIESCAQPLGSGEVEIEVRAAGLNFRDVLKALDVYPLHAGEACSFGDECAGVVRRVAPDVTSFAPGDEVVAVAPGSFGNVVRAHACLVQGKPTALSFEQAATIPIAFLTADHALNDAARLQPGETVLIHAAAGGVGSAAVQIARRIGATVIGTASSEKHALLRAAGVAHVFNSRDLSFVEGVRAATGGEGVDVVLNSLAGAFLAKSLELVKPLGRFVEIGKSDIFANEALDLHAFRDAASFHAVDLARLIATRPHRIGGRFADLLHRFDTGDYRPPSHVAFASGDVAGAFRLMAQGKHRGKVVVTFDDADPPDPIVAADAAPVRRDATYVVTAGLTGFGFATAEWLVEQGARALVLASRRGIARGDVAATIQAWSDDGIAVRVVACDVADADSVRALFEQARATMPPVRGVFHSAMILHDEPLAGAARDAFASVLAPKAQGAWNLHRATLDVELDHFVLYSSCATLLGSAAQASYVAANRFMEALAEARRSRGLPGLAIGWGPLADVGVVSERPALARHFENVGLTPLDGDDALQWLRFLLRRDVGSAYVMRADWQKLRETSAHVRSSTRFATLAAPADVAADRALPQRLVAASADERLPIVVAHLRRLAASVLGADASTIDERGSLADLGLDSLMAFELKIKIDRDLGVELPVDRVASDTALVRLAKLLVVHWEEQAGLRAPPDVRPLRSDGVAPSDDRRATPAAAD